MIRGYWQPVRRKVPQEAKVLSLSALERLPQVSEPWDSYINYASEISLVDGLWLCPTQCLPQSFHHFITRKHLRRNDMLLKLRGNGGASAVSSVMVGRSALPLQWEWWVPFSSVGWGPLKSAWPTVGAQSELGGGPA